MKCKTCKKEKTEQNFYKGFTECKDCLGEHLNGKSTTQAFEEVKDLLQDNNYIVNQELLYDIFFSDKDEYRGSNNLGKLSDYLRKINSLPQYKEYKYKIINEEKSDIDFINDDIRELKVKISKSLEKEDFNAHNKWMNSLREAIELRDKLENKSKTINTTNLFVENGSFKLDGKSLYENIKNILKREKLI